MSAKKVKCFIGTGGVGKTTLASLYALKTRDLYPNKNIKLITIDPSNRLKSFFDMEEGQSQKKIDNLTIELNNRTKSLNDFIFGSLGKESEESQKILNNKLFKSLMDGLAVSQEFSSLYEISRNHKNKDVDFLIIDTPPLQNTSDFLKSAESLNAFFSSSLVSFFLSGDDKGFIYKVINLARKRSLDILAGLTGSNFVDEISFFFKVVESVRGDILKTLKHSTDVLYSEADILLVGNANELSLCGLNLALKIFKEDELKIEKCFLNKYDPQNMSKSTNDKMSKLKESFGELKFIEIPKFKKELFKYSDLNEVKKDVIF